MELIFLSKFFVGNSSNLEVSLPYLPGGPLLQGFILSFSVGGMGAEGEEWRMMRLRHLNANDIPPLYVINISLRIKTSFEVMFKGCIPIMYTNWG